MTVEYDRIGAAYSRRRRTDDRLAAPIWRALGTAQTVVNVGAGTGSYEPPDRELIAIEPSEVMIRQRPPTAAPAILGYAESLPLDDDSVDAAMSVFSVHHWSDPFAGVAEMLRVARGPVVLVTYDAEVAARNWLSADYLPELGELHHRRFPAIDGLVQQLGGARVEAVPVPRDCVDGFVEAYWARPELILTPEMLAATSAFAALDDGVVERARAALEADLESGAWARRHGELRELAELDVGLRIVAGSASRTRA